MITKCKKPTTYLLKALLTIIFATLINPLAHAVDLLMPSSGTNSRALSPDTVYTIYDPGGASQSYPDNCSGHLVLTAPTGYLISLDGEINLYNSNHNGADSLALYSTANANASSWLIGYTTSATCLITIDGGCLHLYFHSNSTGNASGFAITVRLVPPIEPLPSSACVDFLSITSPGTNAYYGTFSNPSQHSGVAPGRHEIVYFDNLDPNTNNQLHRIPPGESHSIRLGNDLPGGQAERITYTYEVDTTIAPLLILKYAAVLQAPNHSADRNPKFSFRLLDQYGNDINATCYSATFVADASLGWNACTPSGSSTVNYWKDWTTVGVDLANVHGQTITIELTSYDCNPQNTGHYGYAYFTIGCAEKTITTTSCGTFVHDTLTAPSGFTYSWHSANNPNVVLGTSQQYVASTPGTYGCYLNFIGDPTHTCQFELHANVNSSFPFASFLTDLETNAVGAQQVCFTNHSGIAPIDDTAAIDSSRAFLSQWYFGDGTSSTTTSPCHYYTPGQYDVMLIVNETGRPCSDTAIMHLVIPDLRIDTLRASFCPATYYPFFDTLISTPGTYIHDSDTARTVLILTLAPSYDTTIVVNAVENQLPYIWDGLQLSADLDTTLHLHTVQGCDSLVRLLFHVFHNTHTQADTTLCSSQLPWQWCGIVFQQPGTATATLAGSHGQDSTVELTLHIIQSYQYDTSFSSCDSEPFLYNGTTYTTTGTYPITYTAQNGCDSVITLHLTIEATPTINITATPPFASPDNPIVSLHSSASHTSQWQWTLMGDVISTSPDCELLYPTYLDSVEVCLTASSPSGCSSTQCIIIPLSNSIVWVPNAFTPDLTTNTTFAVSCHKIQQAHLWIYNRHGLLITHFDALCGQWDGGCNGTPCPMGTYTWLLQYSTTAEPENTLIQRGTVLLIR